MNRTTHNNGFVLISTILMLSVLLSLTGAYFVITNIELATTRYSRDSTTGFYTAEAGLNIRAEQVRATFLGYNRPEGSSPTTGSTACEESNQGSGDFACTRYDMAGHEAITYLNEDPENPLILTVPPGERYQNLNAQEYRYTVNSLAQGITGNSEAILELRFKSRLVPLFQFAAFYNKDLEILPGPAMDLAGPVHSNGDLYLDAGNKLAIDGQVTTAGDLYRGRKNDSTCKSNAITIPKQGSPTAIIPSCSGRHQVTENDIESWNGMIEMQVDIVTVPEPEVFDPVPGAVYWAKADLRMVLNLRSNGTPDTSNSARGIEVRNVNNSVDSTYTAHLDNTSHCPGNIDGYAVGTHNSNFYNNREGKWIQMLDIDLVALLNCIDNYNLMGSSKGLDDTSEGGLVFHFTIKGPDSEDINNYGVRIQNANPITSTNGGAPSIQGITIVSDQALYTQGHYNKDNKIPAALLGDSYNCLSTNWDDSNSNQSLSSRVASHTTVHSALLAGTDSTGGLEGAGGQGGNYNGGLENYPRFHEKWSNKTLTYYGSFVSLNTPRRVTGAWHYGDPQYQAPIRDWHYDTDYNNAANLPPLTPRFVYLRQELFVRKYD